MGCFTKESDVGQLYSMEKYGVWENHLVNPVHTGLSLGRHTAHSLYQALGQGLKIQENQRSNFVDPVAQ